MSSNNIGHLITKTITTLCMMHGTYIKIKKYKKTTLRFHGNSFFLRRCDPTPVMASSFLRFPRSHTTTHHSRQDSSGRMISSSQRPLPDNTHNTHNRQTSMPPVGFEPTISAGERPQTYALDRAATGTGFHGNSSYTNFSECLTVWSFSVFFIVKRGGVCSYHRT